MELFDRIVTLGTILLIAWLFVRNPWEFIREWVIRPFLGAEVADRMAARSAHPGAPASAPDDAPDAHDARMHADDARAHAQGVAPDARSAHAHAHDVRIPAQLDEQARIDCAARALAARLSGEAAIIELMFDGVTRGGGARYLALRDAVRERAQAYGARHLDKARTITISNKREINLYD